MPLAVCCLLATSDQTEAEVVHGPLGQVFYKKAAAYGFTLIEQGFPPHTLVSRGNRNQALWWHNDGIGWSTAAARRDANVGFEINAQKDPIACEEAGEQSQTKVLLCLFGHCSYVCLGAILRDVKGPQSSTASLSFCTGSAKDFPLQQAGRASKRVCNS